MAKIEIEKIFTVTLEPGDLIVDFDIKRWCRFPYKPTGKYRGCPNSLGPGKSCREPMFYDVADWPACFVIAIGKFREYRERFAADHRQKYEEKYRDVSGGSRPRYKPLTEKQLRCPLYWQGQIRKVLKAYTKQLIKDKERLFHEKYLSYTDVPEGFGVNVLETLWNLGYTIPKHPDEEVWKVNLIYRRKQII